jgi:hypothetical protein
MLGLEKETTAVNLLLSASGLRVTHNTIHFC